MRTREIRRAQAEPVGANKPAKRGCSDGSPEVGLADSTPRQGEPATWGSGQQDLSSSKET